MVRTITGPYLITTSPSLTVCRKCRHRVLAATVGGIDRHVDPVPLNALGEFRALVSGVVTYELRGDFLFRRTKAHISAGVGSPEASVLPAHTCYMIPDTMIDHSHMDRAIRLCQQLLGTEVIPGFNDDEQAPPF